MSKNKNWLTCFFCMVSNFSSYAIKVRREQIKQNYVPCFTNRKCHKGVSTVNGQDIKLNDWCKVCLHNRECTRW